MIPFSTPLILFHCSYSIFFMVCFCFWEPCVFDSNSQTAQNAFGAPTSSHGAPNSCMIGPGAFHLSPGLNHSVCMCVRFVLGTLARFGVGAGGGVVVTMKCREKSSGEGSGSCNITLVHFFLFLPSFDHTADQRLRQMIVTHLKTVQK